MLPLPSSGETLLHPKAKANGMPLLIAVDLHRNQSTKILLVTIVTSSGKGKRILAQRQPQPSPSSYLDLTAVIQPEKQFPLASTLFLPL